MNFAHNRSALISGGGIAGLTAAVLLKEVGWEPLVIEREPGIPPEGYVMDFFGTGWDVAERMGLTDELRALRYPIHTLEYVDDQGRPFLRVPLARVRKALDDRYAYLRRPDLARILYQRAGERGVEVRFGKSIRSLTDTGNDVRVVFEDGEEAAFGLLIGADGVHSHTRQLVFGPEQPFARYLGYYVAAFQVPPIPEVRRKVILHEEADRVAFFYALTEDRMDTTYVFREADIGFVPPGDRLPILRQRFAGAKWIAESVLQSLPESSPIFFDSLTQIVMPKWSAGRACLIGDACGCLTLIAGQGSHMAMAGAYVLVRELTRSGGDHAAAFGAYERFLRPHVERKQKEAVWMASRFVPSARSRMWLRRLVLRAVFSALSIRWVLRQFGAQSVLWGYR